MTTKPLSSCQRCKAKPRIAFELVCQSCFDKATADVAVHYQKKADEEHQTLLMEADDRWRSFISTQPHLFEYDSFNKEAIQKSHHYKTIDAYCKAYTIKDYNQGCGLMFVSDFSNKALQYAMYTLRRVMFKHFMNSHGLVSFDYTHISECIANVFGSPAESLYATSCLLLLDSVNLESICENKHDLKAFTAFIKYRTDLFRPTFMVVSNAYNKLPKELDAYFAKAFSQRLLIN